MHYSAGPARKHPLTANLRAHTLSVRSPQPRYIVRGTKGTFTKFGVDVQEEQLKALSNAIFKTEFGREPESLWGRAVLPPRLCAGLECRRGEL